MIYVRRDGSIIPAKLLAVAARAQHELNALDEPARRAFIKKKAHIWRKFGCYLAQMSYGKCWYSESPDPQSFFDVDHYRPKLEAKRSESQTDVPGYEWLAFSWENFRYAANCSNRLNQNIETGAMEGKGSWFPLLQGSVKASWTNRCEAQERAILLDPTVQADIDLIEIQDDGRVGPSRLSVGTAKVRVSRSCELYGLNLPRLKEARLRLMREMHGLIEALSKTVTSAASTHTPDEIADSLPVVELCKLIREKTLPSGAYSRAAKRVVIREGWAELSA
jgi:hypothetical protein